MYHATSAYDNRNDLDKRDEMSPTVRILLLLVGDIKHGAQVGFGHRGITGLMTRNRGPHNGDNVEDKGSEGIGFMEDDSISTLS